METESEITSVYPSIIEETCEACYFTSENEIDKENHLKTPQDENLSEIETVIDSESQDRESFETRK